MQTYESKFFGLQMQIPDGWTMRVGQEDDLKEFARKASRWKPTPANGICFADLRQLVYATIAPVGGGLGSEVCIDFKACVQTDEVMGHDNERRSLKTWKLNGISILYNDDVKRDDSNPEAMHYRFLRWKFGPNLWLYASIHTRGKARFDMALSVFATLAPLGAKLRAKKNPLYEQAPWVNPTSLYILKKDYSDDSAPYYDLAFASDYSDEVLHANQRIASERANSSDFSWTPLALRRVSRARVSDLYTGPKHMGYSTGIFSERAVDLLRPYMKSDFTLLPCTVNGKPHYYIVKKKAVRCLDVENSLISRFSDGTIMGIERYRIRSEAVPDPRVFSVPEARQTIFVTASIAAMAKQAGLKGIVFGPIDGQGREYVCPG